MNIITCRIRHCGSQSTSCYIQLRTPVCYCRACPHDTVRPQGLQTAHDWATKSVFNNGYYLPVTSFQPNLIYTYFLSTIFTQHTSTCTARCNLLVLLNTATQSSG